MKTILLGALLLFLASCATQKGARGPKTERSSGAAEHDLPSDAEELAEGGHPGGGQSFTNPALALQAAMRDPDPASRASALETLAPLFTKHPKISEMIATSQVQTYAELHDLDAMRTWSRKVQVRDNTAYASILNAMAYAYAEQGEHLEEGLIRVDQALAILDRIRAKTKENPAYANTDALNAQRAAFLDTRGWLFFGQHKHPRALKDLEAALAILDDPEIHWHRCRVLEALERRTDAIRACADVLVYPSGTFQDPARTKLRALGATPEEALAAARERYRLRRRAAALRRAIDRPTPTLSIQGPSGEPIPFGGDEKPGQIQVFWLWATWCKPCLVELPMLEALASEPANRDVRFLAINVDADRALADRFLERRPLAVPVAYGKIEALMQTLRLGGLPALFIRDPQGKIRFVHQGFSRDLGLILGEELDALRAP